MSTESSLSFNSTVKSVEFFPYEWSHNLLAICLHNNVKIYSFMQKQTNHTEVNFLIQLILSFEIYFSFMKV